jgi:hypothetical protein
MLSYQFRPAEEPVFSVRYKRNATAGVSLHDGPSLLAVRYWTTNAPVMIVG